MLIPVFIIVYVLMGLMTTQFMPKKVRDTNDLFLASFILWPIVLPVRIIVAIAKFVAELLIALKNVYIEIFNN